jgi:hypothetical protein
MWCRSLLRAINECDMKLMAQHWDPVEPEPLLFGERKES